MMSAGAGIRGTVKDGISPEETGGENFGIKRNQLPGVNDFLEDCYCISYAC